jgi:uracil phosphoribosyltransferase
MAALNEQVTMVQSRALKHLFTKIRDENTKPEEFVSYSQRIMRILAEEGIASLPASTKEIKCMGTGASFIGEEIDISNACAVSVVRAGDSLLEAVRACSPSIAVGKILIQRDESTPEKLPKLFYCKLPKGVKDMNVLLCDPMLATGGSCKMAIKSLIDAGVNPEKIIYLNVISCPEGLNSLSTAYPMVKIISTMVDDGMNEEKYIIPGLGDYGDRYFNTV